MERDQGFPVPHTNEPDPALSNQIVNEFLIGFIQSTGGFIQEDEFRLPEENTPKCDPLLLTKRQDIAPIYAGVQITFHTGQHIRQVYLCDDVANLLLINRVIVVRVAQLIPKTSGDHVGTLWQKH